MPEARTPGEKSRAGGGGSGIYKETMNPRTGSGGEGERKIRRVGGNLHYADLVKFAPSQMHPISRASFNRRRRRRRARLYVGRRNSSNRKNSSREARKRLTSFRGSFAEGTRCPPLRRSDTSRPVSRASAADGEQGERRAAERGRTGGR